MWSRLHTTPLDRAVRAEGSSRARCVPAVVELGHRGPVAGVVLNVPETVGRQPDGIFGSRDDPDATDLQRDLTGREDEHDPGPVGHGR